MIRTVLLLGMVGLIGMFHQMESPMGAPDPVMITAATSGVGDQRVHADVQGTMSGPTIELITQEWVKDPTGQWLVTRYHDKVSGVEFVCVYHSGCVLTGRSWKH